MKVIKDYRLIGNSSGTTLIIKFIKPCEDMHGLTQQTPSSKKHRSPSATTRDCNRSIERAKSKHSTIPSPSCMANPPADLDMPPSNIVCDNNKHKERFKSDHSLTLIQEFDSNELCTNVQETKVEKPEKKYDSEFERNVSMKDTNTTTSFNCEKSYTTDFKKIIHNIDKGPHCYLALTDENTILSVDMDNNEAHLFCNDASKFKMLMREITDTEEFRHQASENTSYKLTKLLNHFYKDLCLK